ncbi:MAG: GAF domain-containing protein [Anaerolineales bacterium]|jgi:PAS domain S-box-containing protein
MGSKTKSDRLDRENVDAGDPPIPIEIPNSWQDDLDAARDIHQAAQTTASILGKYLEYDLLELNVLDLSTGIFNPHRIHTSDPDFVPQNAADDGYRLGEGFTGWLVENREPLIIADIQKESELKPSKVSQSLPMRSFLGVPIQQNSDLIGTLEIAHREAGKYTQRDLVKIEKVRDAIALKLANLQRDKELQAIQLLAGIQQELLGKIRYITRPGTLIAEIGMIILERFETDWIAFLTYNKNSSCLETIPPVVNRQGPMDNYNFSIPSPPDSPLSSLWNTQNYWIVNRIQSDEVIQRLALGDALSGIEADRFVLAPLSDDGDRFGILVAGRSGDAEPFSEEQGVVLNSIGSICGPILKVAIDLEEMSQNAEKANDDISRESASQSTYTDTLLQITGELAASMDLDHLLTRVVNALRQATSADRGAFLLTVPDSKTLILRASSGGFPAPPPGGRATPYQLDEGLAGWVIQNRMPVCIGDLTVDERWVPHGGAIAEPHSALAAPLIVSEQVHGAVVLLGNKRHAFSEEDLELLSAAANQIAPAIHNAQLYHLIQEQSQRLGLALRNQQVESSQSQAVLHAMTDGVIVTDAQHRIQVFNPAAEQILGITREEALGESVFEISASVGPATGEIIDKLRAWDDQGATSRSINLPPRRIETEHNRVLAIQPAPVVLGDDFLGAITIIRDVTRDVELDRMKSEFVATVSHELRSPITPIKGFVDLLRMGIPGSLTEEQTRYLDIISQNIHRLEMLVDELLDISRIEAGKVVLTFQALNVEQLIDEIKEYVDHRSKTEQKQMSLQSSIDAAIPDIWGDSERVRQILTNIVDNSFDYTPAGGTIKVSAQHVGDQIEIAIRDNGMGIAVREQDRIFERFYRGEQALIMGVAGAGLGLSIALTMVEMHGGRIWVNSSGIPGKGSTFTVSLPTASPNSKPEKVIHTP